MPSDGSSLLANTVNKMQLLQLINQVRQQGCQCGDTYYNPVPAVAWNNLLEEAAFAHSADMYQNNYFSHIAPDGSNAGQRINRTGYRWLTYGENIGKGYRTEKEVVDAWLGSPGHCKNIMAREFKEMGIGKAGDYWTQAFGTR